ncbi:uncharacterized protein [Dermacentor albipictus]|uniref:uncharacterized protein n=1 Tax=Dermacentor albipictus TaxID=60249 RepID=UPI0038FD0DB6
MSLGLVLGAPTQTTRPEPLETGTQVPDRGRCRLRRCPLQHRRSCERSDADGRHHDLQEGRRVANGLECPASPSQLPNLFGSPVTYTEGIPEDYLLRIHSVYEQEAPWRSALASVVPEPWSPAGCGAGMRDQDGRRMRRRNRDGDAVQHGAGPEEAPAKSGERSQPREKSLASRNVAHCRLRSEFTQDMA